MPLPSGLQTVTVTAGPYTAADGSAAVGSVIFTPAAPIHHTPTGAVILAGPIAVRLDSSGSASVVLPASDAAGITPTGVTYGVQFAFAYGTPTPPPFDVLLPAASPTVDLDGLTPVTSSAGVGVSVPMLTIPQIVADPALRAAFVRGDRLPQARPIPQAGGTQLTAFQPAHGWTIGGGNPGTVTDDAAIFTLGSQSLKVTTNGAGGTTRAEKTVTSFDATKFSVAVLLRVSDVSKLSSLKARIGSGAAAAYNLSLWANNLITSTLRSGEWTWITFDCANTSNIGTPPAQTTITYLGIEAQDTAAGAIAVNLQAVKLVPKPSTLFPNGVVSVSFDDGYADQISNAKPILDKYGFPATAYVISDLLGGAAPGLYGTIQQFLDAQNYSGWEIAAHAARAADHNLPGAFTDLTPAQMEAECQDMLNWSADNGFPVPSNMAWPQGKYSTANMAVVRKYFTMARTIDFQPNIVETMPPPRLMEVRCRPMDAAMTAATITAMIDQAYTNADWLNLYTHRILPSGAAGTQMSTATLTTVVDYLATKGIPVRTVGSVLQSLAAGRA